MVEDETYGSLSKPSQNQPEKPVLARFFIGSVEYCVYALPADLQHIARVAAEDGHQPVYWFPVVVEDISSISRRALGYRIPGVRDLGIPPELGGG